MRNQDTEYPDISEHLAVVDKFLDGELSAERFEHDYLHVFKHSKGLIGEPLHEKLSDIFFALEDYVPDPDLRTEKTDIDEEEMTRRVRRARSQLAALLNER